MDKEILDQNQRLIYTAVTIKSCLPTKQSRTRRWMTLKFQRAVKELERLGQNQKTSFEVLAELGIEWPNCETEKIKPLPLP